MNDGRSGSALREQLTHLCSLLSLSTVMSDGHDERQIVALAADSVASLSSCRPVASLLTTDCAGLRAADDSPVTCPELTARLAELHGADGPILGLGWTWCRAYALCTADGHVGHLVVAADEEPPAADDAVLRLLAQQTGAALGAAARRRQEQTAAGELRVLNARLLELNDRLSASVVDLEWHRKVHETLGAVAASGAGEPGITDALQQLTGLSVAAEDRFGNLRCWAGPNRPEPYPRVAARHRAEVLATACRTPGPIRDRDRLIAVARPRDEVLGVLALLDPERRAGEHELYALDCGAAVLTLELAHRHSLAESELRLRHLLVDDLLAGIDDESARSRSQALGHDLAPPHQVAVIRWPGAPTEDALVEAVEHALSPALDTTTLVARRPDGVVVLAPVSGEREARRRWGELHRAVRKSLRSPAGAIGVGCVCRDPSAIPTSYAQARRALRVRLGSSCPKGVTAYADLGIYRLLTLGEDDEELRGFVREWLGPLLDYDRTSGSHLVPTLCQYLDCGGNYDAAARGLLIHRSTLRYRLRRIREVGGRDLNVVDNRLNLHVATRAWQIVRGGCDPPCEHA